LFFKIVIPELENIRKDIADYALAPRSPERPADANDGKARRDSK
jgi:hypothetical protein